MAATVTREDRVEGGYHVHVLTITETSVAAATEYEIDNLPPVMTIVQFKATLTGGTGTTIQPEVGRATGWSTDTNDQIRVEGSAAAHIDNDSKKVCHLSNNKLVIRSTPDTASDNAVSTEIVLIEGVV